MGKVKEVFTVMIENDIMSFDEAIEFYKKLQEDEPKRDPNIPEYFDVIKRENGFNYYINEQGGYYVPQNKLGFEGFIFAAFAKIKRPTREQVRNFDLIRKYPFLLPKNRWDLSLDLNGEDGFDFTYTEIDSMPYGWYKAFGEKMLDELKEFFNKHNPNAMYQYMIMDIKEKYGGLRWYDNGLPEGGYDIISKYEDLSYNTCFICGEPSTYMTTGYILPLCDKCKIEKEKKKEK